MTTIEILNRFCAGEATAPEVVAVIDVSHKALVEALTAIRDTLDEYEASNAFAVVTHARRLAADALEADNQ
jgi:hypothetical protein